jgi:hypothetical protein
LDKLPPTLEGGKQMALPELFTMYRGDDYTVKLTFTDDLTNPVPITDWVIKASLKLSPEMPDGDITSVEIDLPALTGTDPANGIVYLNFPNEQTVNMVSGTYYLDVQKEHMGAVMTVLKGTVIVEADVTRRIS